MSTPTDYHMSLSYVVLNGFQLNPFFYSCPDNWTMMYPERVKSPYLGTFLMIGGSIYLTLYSLCLLAMLNRDLVRHPAYKIMVALAFCDIPSICIDSLFSGYFGFKGIHFCDYPLLIYIQGAIAFGLWMGCTFCCSALALCRISEINPDLKIGWIFKKPFLYVLMAIIFGLPFYGVFFTKPVIFRPEYMSWFLDPGTGHADPIDYHNMTQLLSNAIEGVTTTILYTYLVSYLIRNRADNSSPRHVHMQRNVIIQAAIICFFHSVASSLYTYMQYFHSPGWLIIAAQINWQTCTGFISVIYLTLNRTIRLSVRKMLCPKKFEYGNQVSTFSNNNAF